MTFRVKACRICGRDEFEIGAVSTAGYCEECGIRRGIEAAVQMAAKNGPAWERWKAGMRRFIDREGV